MRLIAKTRSGRGLLLFLSVAVSAVLHSTPSLASGADFATSAHHPDVRCEAGRALTRSTSSGLPLLVGSCEGLVAAAEQGETGVTASGEADCLVPGFDDRCEAWTAPRYDGPWGGADHPGFGSFDRHTTVLAHPTEDLVFVAGTNTRPGNDGGDADFVEIAYRASTGQPVWTSTYEGFEERTLAYQSSIALSPDGETLYAIGIAGEPGVYEYASVVVAFETSTGKRLWDRRTPISAKAIETAMTTLENGTIEERVYIVGGGGATSPSGAPVPGGAVSALDPDDGGEIWTSRFAGETPQGARFNELVVSPDGSAVYAGGGEHGADMLAQNFVTVGFRATDGEKLWVTRDVRTQPTKGNNGISDMAITPDGSRVLVTGFDSVASNSLIVPSTSAILTVAHDTLTGEQAWRHAYGGPVEGETHFYFSLFQGMMGLSPDGRTAVVTAAINSHNGTGTVAYDVATGTPKWGVESQDALHAYVAVNYLGYYPAVIVGNDRAYVSNRRGFGVSQYRTVTMGYSLGTGVLGWTGRLGTNRTLFGGNAIAADGQRVFVTTADQLYSTGLGPDPGLDSTDILTVAYDA
jgi:hypothetical protein